jgi:hypothetical protein
MSPAWAIAALALIGCGSVNGVDLGGAGGGSASSTSTGTTTGTDTAFTGPSVCESGVTLPVTGAPDASMDGDGSMDPGTACLACHATGPGPRFALGGTVFATGHVPDLCQPTNAQSNALGTAEVIITDATGATHGLLLDGTGNFHFEEGQTLPFPYQAKVTYMGKERAMLSAQSNGDCNACHTDAGASNAPGRIALPD